MSSNSSSSGEKRPTNFVLNERRLEKLLESPAHTDTEKREFKKSKLNFDQGFSAACKEFQKQIKTFNENYVLLEGSLDKYGSEKYLPRTFTLVSLVQRHLLREELTKNNVGFSFYWGHSVVPLRLTTADPVLWPRPLRSLSLIYLSLIDTIQDGQNKTTVDTLLQALQTALVFHEDSCKADLACLKNKFPTLPPLLVKQLFQFLLYFCFEDYLIFCQRPRPNREYINMNCHYFMHLFSQPAGAASVEETLSCVLWEA